MDKQQTWGIGGKERENCTKYYDWELWHQEKLNISFAGQAQKLWDLLLGEYREFNMKP